MKPILFVKSDEPLVTSTPPAVSEEFLVITILPESLIEAVTPRPELLIFSIIESIFSFLPMVILTVSVIFPLVSVRCTKKSPAEIPEF